MNSTAPPPRPNRALPAIFWGGLICGALDITAAFIVYGAFGARPIQILQGVASGLLGSRSFSGGLPTAALGLFFQFFIAFTVATIYYAASRALPFLVTHALTSGTLYGIAVYFFMNHIVVPLSAATKFPFSLRGMLIGVTIHTFCVGLPVAIATRKFSAT